MPCPVFVEFDCDERRFGLAAETGDRPGVRVGLLVVIDRPMREELPKLPPFAVVTEEIAHASAVDRFDQQLVELLPGERTLPH